MMQIGMILGFFSSYPLNWWANKERLEGSYGMIQNADQHPQSRGETAFRFESHKSVIRL